MGYAVKLQNSKMGIQDKQITIKIAGRAQFHYQTYTSGDATGYVNNRSLIGCTIPTSSSNPGSASNSTTVWLSQIAAM